MTTSDDVNTPCTEIPRFTASSGQHCIDGMISREATSLLFGSFPGPRELLFTNPEDALSIIHPCVVTVNALGSPRRAADDRRP